MNWTFVKGERAWPGKAFPLVLAAMMLLFVVGVGLLLSRSVGKAVPVAERVRCAANLRAMYDGLLRFASLNGDVPRDSEGNFSFSPLTDTKAHMKPPIDSSVLRCPADRRSTGTSYVVNPSLAASDLAPGSNTVVACDRPTNHTGLSLVLLGDGSVRLIAMPLERRERWTRLLMRGDKLAAKVMVKEGGARWYMGQGEGYIGNE